jgi:hypothetical protein
VRHSRLFYYFRLPLSNIASFEQTRYALIRLLAYISFTHPFAFSPYIPALVTFKTTAAHFHHSIPFTTTTTFTTLPLYHFTTFTTFHHFYHFTNKYQGIGLDPCLATGAVKGSWRCPLLLLLLLLRLQLRFLYESICGLADE